MSVAANKSLACHFFEEVYNQRNLTVVEEFVAPHCVNYNNPISIGSPGPEGVRRTIVDALAGYPDLHISIEDVIAENDKVVLRETAYFTHPTENRPVKQAWIEIIRMEDGKAVEAWSDEQAA